MTSEIKASFHSFDVAGLTAFYKGGIEDGKIRDLMFAFGISPTTEENKDCLCKALSLQLRAFVDSDTDEADDIVAIEYQKLLAEPQMEIAKSYHPATVLYPGDQIYFKSKCGSIYKVNIYEKFQHTWEFENTGSQVWRGRRLIFSNHGTVRPRAEVNYIDIPETPPHKGVKLTVNMDARGFEGTSECKWIMVDSDGNDCFPNSNTFTFIVITKYAYQK